MSLLYQVILLAFAANLARSLRLLWRLWRGQGEHGLAAETSLVALITLMVALYLPLQISWVAGHHEAALPDWEAVGWACFDLYLCGLCWAVEAYINNKVGEADA